MQNRSSDLPGTADNRCLRQFSDGRRCRMLRKSGHSSLCVFHAHEEEQLIESEKLAAEFASLSGRFTTAIDVNHVLGKVFDAFAHKRISHRTANTFGYLGQLLLQSMPQVRREINGACHNSRAFDGLVADTIPFFRRVEPDPKPRR
jgi:hypothetical protein